MRRTLHACTAAMLLAASTGCYQVNVTINHSLVPTSENQQARANGFLFGMVPGAVNLAACKSDVEGVETKQTFWNRMTSLITFGVYIPSEVTMSCGSEIVTSDVSVSAADTFGRRAGGAVDGHMVPPASSVYAGEGTDARGAGQQPSATEKAAAVPNIIEREYEGASFYLDQDTFLKHSTDQFYTMGGVMSRSGRWVKDEHLDWPQRRMDEISGFLFFRRRGLGYGHRPADSVYSRHVFQGGISAFTPQKGFHYDESQRKIVYGDSLADTLPHYKDRPYACLVFLESQHTEARGRRAYSSGFTLGALGLGVCRSIQTSIHQHITHDVRPGGWRYQISNGGEPTFKYRAGVKQLLVDRTLSKGNASLSYDPAVSRWLEITTDIEANAGYYTNAAGGLRLRAGLINSPFWGVERRPVSNIQLPRALGAPQGRHVLGLDELYGWVSGGATYWVANALLQGQFIHNRDEVRLSFDDADSSVATLNRWVGDLEAGITARAQRFSLTYQFNYHSPAFRGEEKRPHAWGGVYITFVP